MKIPKFRKNQIITIKSIEALDSEGYYTKYLKTSAISFAFGCKAKILKFKKLPDSTYVYTVRLKHKNVSLEISEKFIKGDELKNIPIDTFKERIGFGRKYRNIEEVTHGL